MMRERGLGSLLRILGLGELGLRKGPSGQGGQGLGRGQ